MKTTKILTLSLILPTLAFQSCEKKNSSNTDQNGHTGDCCPPPSELIAPEVSAGPAPTPQLNETPEQLEKRLQWFRNAKFGLFIHWGPAAISGEEISWSMMDRIEGGDKHKVVPRETYMNLYKTFNPTNFNADELMGLAKNAGMKYFVLLPSTTTVSACGPPRKNVSLKEQTTQSTSPSPTLPTKVTLSA